MTTYVDDVPTVLRSLLGALRWESERRERARSDLYFALRLVFLDCPDVRIAVEDQPAIFGAELVAIATGAIDGVHVEVRLPVRIVECDRARAAARAMRTEWEHAEREIQGSEGSARRSPYREWTFGLVPHPLSLMKLSGIA